MVTPGCRDLDNQLGSLKKDAPILPVEVLFFMIQVVASNGWSTWSKDVEAALLSRGYFDREIFVTVPRGEPPATKVLGWSALPEGTVLSFGKLMPGLADAPLEEHNA